MDGRGPTGGVQASVLLEVFSSPVGTSESTTAVKVKGFALCFAETLTRRGDPLQGRPAGPKPLSYSYTGEPVPDTSEETCHET